MSQEVDLRPSEQYYLTPDYKRPPYQLPEHYRSSFLEKLTFLFGEIKAHRWLKELERILKVHYACKSLELIEWEKKFKPDERFTERDVILITYGDLIRDEVDLPLETLAGISKKYFKGVFNTIHILPFFPYSSDRGFSVRDFTQVDPLLGRWEDILDLKDHFRLMFDGVFNHISSKSRWFQNFLNGERYFKDFFIVYSPKKPLAKRHLRKIFRPRTTDVLTRFGTLNGERLVWTTFSADQIDLNFRNPRVLMKMVEILLFYVRKGADIIRLDAVTYLWYERGTTGIHLPQTHMIIKLFRDILDAVAPPVALITETNVPHKDNISYFGNGRDEAQLVYNFALPPLVLHTFYKGNAEKLTSWAKGLEYFSESASYFNFLDSHDGIGVMGVKDILSSEEINDMCKKVLEHGGRISHKKDSDGSHTPYEMNITFYSALNRGDYEKDADFRVKRYLAARSIPLVLKGVPGVYLHGLLGSKNDIEAVLEGQESRSINRKNLNKTELVQMLEDPETTTHKVSSRLTRMIKIRTREKVFHPNAAQKVLDASSKFFSVVRSNEGEYIIAIANVASEEQIFELDLREVGLKCRSWHNILWDQDFKAENNKLSLTIGPYDVKWLKSVK